MPGLQQHLSVSLIVMNDSEFHCNKVIIFTCGFNVWLIGVLEHCERNQTDVVH